jgi:hypothetical protein
MDGQRAQRYVALLVRQRHVLDTDYLAREARAVDEEMRVCLAHSPFGHATTD